ncbi:hypothetical protein BATDEDRAFT_28329 [Batrachochytrium dendrobatidis JAM81]|uniref:Uncharacterized protein n=1 Tax=Batrachochytrium dendrobatidis (strain JAM81 / FGSC 10211) TaxID=684364 RepID=F4PDQ2_BATDJ|nr:uncharacterized protein BATDEDRAFT_28329 [Batrachochytrium dendrobatidis JAM81]EGF76718.1 hypothetical protein BATDEDRAFT_28329 [Batrachochytrium dendrobatidis JAM81]|eukprot:XP_006682628.1 hypothetical protein BATDEDRAFT_28329 [Batrachochytrium dendrobatidis JAM81]
MPKRFLNVEYDTISTEIDVTDFEDLSDVQDAIKAEKPSKSAIFDAGSTSLSTANHQYFSPKRQRTEPNVLTTQFKSFANAQLIDECIQSTDHVLFPYTQDKIQKLYVRECYHDVFGLLLDQIDRGMESFAISGTSGIGKSLFFVYILHRLMDDFTTKTLSLKPNRIVYQVGSSYKCFDLQQQLVTELGLEVANTVWKQDTLYVVDGHTTPRSSCCIVLFMSSPQSEGYKEFVKQKMAKEWDFPVWTLDELQTCRRHCYPDVPIDTINERYRMYGGVARSVFDIVSNPMEKALTDVDTVKGVRNIGFTIKISANTHILLHTIVSDDGQYRFLHVDIASRYVGEQLWQHHSAQMITNMQQMFGSIPTEISRHLFEIYGHVVFCTGGQTLKCRCLEDGKATKITLDALNGQRITFGINTIPTAAALDGNYYEPTNDNNFAAIDSLSQHGMFQFTVAAEHPIREKTHKLQITTQLYVQTLLQIYVVVYSKPVIHSDTLIIISVKYDTEMIIPKTRNLND